MKVSKIIFVLSSALLLVSGCIPTTPGGTPATTFNINMQADRESFTDIDTTIVIDGDSLTFYINCFNFFDYTDYFIISSTSADFEYINIKNYAHHITTNAIDSSSILTDVNALNGGVLINNSYSANAWTPFVFTNNQYHCLSIFYRTTDFNPVYVNGLYKNLDQYIVLRKLKGTQYQYYWIKVRNNEVPGSTNTIRILNGKYQMNSITTGQ